jgi:hypothetical protein
MRGRARRCVFNRLCVYIHVYCIHHFSIFTEHFVITLLLCLLQTQATRERARRCVAGRRRRTSWTTTAHHYRRQQGECCTACYGRIYVHCIYMYILVYIHVINLYTALLCVVTSRRCAAGRRRWTSWTTTARHYRHPPGECYSTQHLYVIHQLYKHSHTYTTLACIYNIVV